VSTAPLPPWTRPAEQASEPPGFWNRLARIVNATWFIAVLFAGGLVALRNVRRGRGDRRGALRFALYLGAARMFWYVGAHHSLSPNEVQVFTAHLAYALERVGITYVLYLAIEPYARRLWPRMLTSWVRVLEGRFRDPLVGRDLLMGCAAGALIALLGRVAAWLPALVGGSQPLPLGSEIGLEPLRGTMPTLLALATIHTSQLFDLFIPLTSILVFRLLLRRTWPALVAVSLLALALFYPEYGSVPLYVVTFSLALTIAWIVLFRGGLLALGATSILSALIEQLPITPQAPVWLLGTTLLCAAVVLAPALYGFFTCQAGRPLLGDAILEPAVRG
jgi:hypothetical protein